MKLTIIRPELDELDQAEVVEVKDQPTLEQLQGYVGGYIELVHIGDGPFKEMYINEEGKLDGLPYNPIATEIWWKQYPPAQGQDFIVGVAVLTDERCK